MMVRDSLRPEGARELASLPEAALLRGILAWVRLTGVVEYSPAATDFAAAHASGERDALRRAAIALSDPRSHGRERQVIAALAGGLDIEDAIRAAYRPEPDQFGSNVVSLRPSISR